MDLSNIPEREEITALRIFPVDLKTVRKYKAIDLSRPETYDQLFVTFLDPQFAAEMGDSLEMINILRPLVEELEKDFPDLFEKYSDLLIYGEFLTIPIRLADQIKVLFENSLIKALTWKIDVRRTIYSYLIHNHFPFDLLTSERTKILLGIQHNNEVVGKNKLQTERGVQRDPTIENWVKDYLAFFNKPGLKNSLDEVNYMEHSKSVAAINPEEKKIIKELIRLYDYLRFPTPINVKPTGHIYDEPTEVKSVSPQPVQSEPKNDPEQQRNKLIEEFIGPEDERKTIHATEEKMAGMANKGLGPVVEEFLKAVKNKDKFTAVAALRTIATKGDFIAELKNNQEIDSQAKELLKKNYKPEVLADFQRNGFTAPYLSVYLQNIFIEKMGLDASESARYGIQLENILAEKGVKEVQGMVYGDLASGKFVWQEVKDEGVKLSILDLAV